MWQNHIDLVMTKFTQRMYLMMLTFVDQEAHIKVKDFATECLQYYMDKVNAFEIVGFVAQCVCLL